jgi:CheY-like chemotaxis protein/putative methionine-R-sulfoxide reductase with GAF domain
MRKLGNLGAILGSSATDDRLSDGAWSLHGSAPVRLLLVEDDEDDAVILKRTLAKIPDARFDVQWVTNGAAALEALATGWYDATLVDYRLGGSTGVELIREATAAGCMTPLIMLTGQRDRTTDMVAMKAGAADFLVKGHTDATLLDRTLRYAITSARIREELRRGREQILGLEQIGRLLAEDWPIDDAIEQLLRVMGDAFEYQYVAVYLRSATGFDLRRARGYQYPVAGVDASDRALERVVSKQQHIIVPNFTRSPDHRDADAAVRLELCLPIVIDGKTIGLLTVGSPDGEQLGERDVTVLGAVAGRLAAALALSLERELIAARGRRFGRLLAVARELGAAVHVGDDPAFWATLAGSACGALGSEVIVLESAENSQDGSRWRQLARSGDDPSTDLSASMLAIADTALADGPTFDGPRNLAAVCLDGWRHPVALISVNGLADAPGETLRQLATALEPVLRLRITISESAQGGKERLSAFCLAIDWAVARAADDGRSTAYTVLVLESLDKSVSSAELAADIRAEARILVAELSPETVGVVLEADPADRSAAPATNLVSTMTKTRKVLGGVSVIGPDLTAAAFDRASGALELARRLGPGNTVVA